MSKVFVIPDIHLKPWILDKAEEFISKGNYDQIVCLGDVIDDWDQEYNLNLYEETFDTLTAFATRHSNFLFCYGNHDVSYIWGAHETGYSEAARGTVLACLSKFESTVPVDKRGYIHRIDNILFSHAGLSDAFVTHFFPEFQGDFDELIGEINSLRKEEMWCDASPIWVRPQDGRTVMYPAGFLQVVGHTPVRKTDFYNNILSVDSFSTYRDGSPIGDQRFVWVDTVSKVWGFADKGNEIEPTPDEKLDIRTYRIGDRVQFKIRFSDSDEDEIHEGTVEIIDRNPGWYSSIDIMSGGTLYKHIPLTDVIEK